MRAVWSRLGLVLVLAACPFAVVTVGHDALDVVLETQAYLVFHNIAEFFSVVVSFSIFGLGWYTFRQSGDRHALFLSTAFLAVGLLDFMHALGYAGMPAFVTTNSVPKATNFWLAARMVTALALLASAFVAPAPGRWGARWAFLAGALVVPTLVFVLVTYLPDSLPTVFLPGTGLTDYKRAVEATIIALFGAAGVAYLAQPRLRNQPEVSLYLTALVLCAGTELAFTLYRSAFDTYNMLGHLYKIVAFGFIYAALFVATVRRPYERLQRSLDEKDTLLKELYHRTKNTLQMIQGLIVLQASEAVDDPAVKELVRKTEDRIQAISLVHQKLFTANDLSRIPLKSYIEDLASLIVRGLHDHGRVRLEVGGDEAQVLLDTAVPLGLILNELITNSLCHAFPVQTPGTIRITLARPQPGTVSLDYRDDGIGFSPEVDLRRPESLGLSLVRSIATQQLRGQIVLEGTEGFQCRLTFADHWYRERV